MNLIRKKLNSENGASLMLALLFFVICAMVGSVILAAATAAAGRIAGLKASDQAKYSLESAAKLLEANISDWTYVRKPMTADTAEGESLDIMLRAGVSVKAASEVNSFDVDTTGSAAGSTTMNCIAPFFANCVQLSVDRRKNDTSGEYGRNPLSVTNSIKIITSAPYYREVKYYLALSESGNSEFPTVIANLKLDYDYTIYADLSIAEASSGGSVQQDVSMPTLMMTFNADFSEHVGTVLINGVQEETTEVNVKWGRPIKIINEKEGVGTT